MTNGTATLIPFTPKSQISYQTEQAKLLNGEILLETQPYNSGGGAVTAHIYFPIERSLVWQHVTDYPRWVQYFPALTHSEVLPSSSGGKGGKRLYQVASKAFLMLTAQVEVHLRVFERMHSANRHQIQFCLEQGSFTDFSADLSLQDWQTGTLLTYAVKATPKIWVPSILIQEAIRLDLPHNLRQMRHVISDYFR